MRKCLPAVCQSFPDVEERTKKLEKPTGFMTDKSILAKETDFGSWSKLADRVRKNRIISTILPALGGFACTCSCACGQPSAVSMKGSEPVLTSLNRLLGMPVVWQDRRVGCVERAVADVRTRMLDGLIVRRGIGSARWISSRDVLLVGERCVLVGCKPGTLPEKEMPEAGRAFLATGECAGDVTDVLLTGSSLRMVALEICAGPLCRLLGRRSYAVDFCVVSTAEENGVMVAQLLSWTQLIKHLEGEERG